ncbi:hypothetical protein G6F56_014183 [Rhizopus delemar]|nr:hypothetical protein G6F56_014183 [Rhizopus delemar]
MFFVITGKVVETIVDNEEVVSAVETIAQESDKVTVDVVTKDKTTKAVVDTSKVQAPKSTDAENIVVGVIGSTVAEIVTKDKDTEDTIKEIVKETV